MTLLFEYDKEDSPMKVSQGAIKEICAKLREHGDQESIDGMQLFLTEDISALFGTNEDGRNSFQGLSFEMIGRDFHVLSNLDLVVSSPGDEEDGSDDEILVIESEELVALVEDYLAWRARVVATLNM